jgi:MFS transporter, PPP family, 3-phenylpropionic acid transporter
LVTEPDADTTPNSEATTFRCWLGLSGFYVASFAVLSVYMAFFPLWLHKVGELSKQQVSEVLAGQTVARTVAGPFWARRVDRAGDARRVLILLSVASLAAFALNAASSAVFWVGLCAVLFGALYSPMYPIIDAAAMQASGERGFAFGRLRMVGSLAYLLTLLAAGYAFDGDRLPLVFGVVLIGLVVMIVSGFGLVRQPIAARREPLAPWWSLLRSSPFVLLLCASAAIQGSHATYYNLSTSHWADHGISTTAAGWIWAEGLLAEILLFFVAQKTVDRLRPTTLLMIGGTAAAVRWCIVGSSTSVPVLLAISWLHAFSFATTYMGTLRALERRVPKEQRATAQGLLGSATSGIGMVVCGLLGGWLYENFETRVPGLAFYAMAAISLLGVAIALKLRWMADRTAAGEG